MDVRQAVEQADGFCHFVEYASIDWRRLDLEPACFSWRPDRNWSVAYAEASYILHYDMASSVVSLLQYALNNVSRLR